MDVIFKPTRGDPFYIEVGYFDTVIEIKHNIQKHHGFPISKQTLIFNGNVLQDELNVHHSDILDRSCIHLVIASDHVTQAKIHLILKIHTSKQCKKLEINVDETIQILKDKIHEMEGLPINRLVLHASGIELNDHNSIRDYGLSDNSEVDVFVQSSPATSASSGSTVNVSKKLRIVVLSICGTKKIPMDVNFSDNVGELRKKLQKLNDKSKLDLPEEGYFFIYKQNVMDDDRTFRWHHVMQGDKIEIFNGIVSDGL